MDRKESRYDATFTFHYFFKIVSEKGKSLNHATPWTVVHQASWSMEFSRPEYWSG